MAGAYLEIPIKRTYSFTSNVASRLSALGTNLSGATLYFLAKSDPWNDADTAAVLTATPTANTNTNVVTVSLTATNTNVSQEYPLLYWEISMTANGGAYYNLDSGRAALIQAVRRG